MSSPIANVEIVAPKAPRVKKPSLPAKYNKFMSFGFWFLNKMDATVRDQLFPELKIFSTIEDQSAFFQSYLDEASASNKIMRKTVAAFHKPPKVRAEKKSRKSSKPVAAESDDLIAKLIADANGSTEPASGDAPVQEKPKKSRKSTKKTEEPATTTDVAAADAPVQEKPKKSTKKSTKKAEEPVTTTEPVAADEPVQEKPKKATKKSTKKAEEPVAPTTTTTTTDAPAVAPVADAPVQEKPKKATKKSTKKTEEPVAAPTEPVAQDDDSDEIQTRIVTIDGGKQYLIDSEYNLYDISSHEQIGKFDPKTNQPILA
jgi:hypothetical protein